MKCATSLEGKHSLKYNCYCIMTKGEFDTVSQILRHYVWRFRIIFIYLHSERRGIGYIPPSFFGGIFKPKTF